MNHKALTLIEILVALTIVSILALSFFTVFKTGLDSWNKTRTKLEIYQNARVALEQMFRELASAVAIENVPSFRGVYSETGSDSVGFISIGEDTIWEITYGLNGDTFERIYDEDADYNFDTTDGTVTLAFNIANLKFRYWGSSTTTWDDAQNDWTGSLAGGWSDELPRAVKITLTDAEEDRTFETVVYLPNSE